MPELPEVETMRRGIAGAAGAVIDRIVRPPSPLQSIEITPPLAAFRRRAVGRSIERVGRLGKRIILELDSGDRVVIEPRMTGLVFLADPPDRKHLRLIIELVTRPSQRRGADGTPAPQQILFWDQRGLGVVRLVSPANSIDSMAQGRSGLTHWTSPWKSFAAASPQPAGNQGGVARPESIGWRGQSLCLGDPAPRQGPSGPALLPAARRTVAANPRRDALRLAGSDRASRLDAPRRHLPHRPRRTGQFSISPSRLSASRAGVFRLRQGGDRADCPGPAIDVLLPGMPAVNLECGSATS